LRWLKTLVDFRVEVQIVPQEMHFDWMCCHMQKA
jgi:hypothetical protein